MATLSKLEQYHVITNDKVDFTKEVNTIQITANTLLDIEKTSLGRSTLLIVRNITAGDLSLAFTGVVGISAADAAQAVLAGSYSIYRLEVHPDGALAQLLSSGSGGPFPSGLDGGLVITNGNTVTINAGDLKDYSSIDIQTGGTLNITDPSNTWNPTQVYCTGAFNLDGQIVFRNTERNTTSKSGNFADGTPYSFTTTQKNGGNGGAAATVGNAAGGGSGAGTNGYGGGGAGGRVNGPSIGGSGGSNNGNGGAGQLVGFNISAGAGGTGNNTNSNGVNGGAGLSQAGGFAGKGGNGGGSGGGGGAAHRLSLFTAAIYGAAGGGGGGGHKGNHGGILYLYSAFPVTGSGIINLSGTNGFNGGFGGASGFSGGLQWTSGGGGGGGGGAGGNGGNLITKIPTYSFSVDVSGGAGGAGRTGGAGSAGGDIGAGPAGGTGGNGQTGNAGSVTDL